MTDLRLRFLRAQAREERTLVAARDALEHEIVGVLKELGTTPSTAVPPLHGPCHAAAGINCALV